VARSRIAVLVLLLAGGGAAGFYLLRGNITPSPSAAAQSVRPEQRKISNTVNASGTVRLRVGSEVRVGSQLSGIVKKLNVTIGSHVNV
jgi:macrolide-specific efflux system membrane fusion protein